MYLFSTIILYVYYLYCRYWRLSGRPTVCLLVREEHMRDPHFKQMLDLFAMLKKGHCDGVKVRLGRLQNLISSSCIGMPF